MANGTQYDDHLEKLRQRDWQLADVPFYKDGMPTHFTDYENLDYLDYYEGVWGRKCGENGGIGRLREVAITKITEAENEIYNKRYPYHEDLDFTESQGLGRVADIPKLQDEQAAYAESLESLGVAVHWMEFGEYPMTPYGPMQAMCFPSDLGIIRGGSVIQRFGWHPFSYGRSEFMARWLQHHLGIPILYTVTGKAVHETSTAIWFAEDLWVTGLGVAYSEDGNRQVEEVIRRTCGVENLEVHTIKCSHDIYFDRQTGVSGHIANMIGPLDIDKVLIYAPGLDTETHRWLKRKGYQCGEVDLEEQVKYTPTNFVPFEPGVVLMVQEATRAIKTVRDMGVEVIEIPNSGFNHLGGAIRCRTLRLLRDPAPFKNQ